MHFFQLGQYKGLGITPQPKYTEAELDAAMIETILHLSAQWSKSNSMVQHGDSVSIRVSATCDGVSVPELNMDNLKYIVGDQRMSPEFMKVIGKRKDDCFQMTIEFPPNSPILPAAGKTINLTAEVLEVYPLKQIHISDDIARQIDPDISSLEELKAKIRRSIENQYGQVMREKNIEAVIEGILKNCTYQLDPDELAEATNQIVKHVLRHDIFMQNPDIKPNHLTASDIDPYLYEDCCMLAEQQILTDLISTEVARQEKFSSADADRMADYLLQWNLKDN